MEDYLDRLIQKITSHTHIPEEDLNFVRELFHPIQVEKGNYLLKEGQYIRHFYFVLNGCICYYTMKDGKEQVIEFLTEDDFFTDLYYYVEESPSKCFFRAVEPTELFAISKTDVQRMFDRSHSFERFGRLLVQDQFMTLSRRVTHLTSLSNEERYLRLIRKRPNLIQRVPQYLIASYLGLTPVGLSKIRKRLSQS